MRRRITFLAAVGALLLLPAMPATAAEPTLTGVVALAGHAAGRVPVAWFVPGSGTVTATRSDADGRFTMPAPPAGARYLLAANVADLLTEPHAADDRFLTAFVGSGADAAPAAPLVQPALADGGSRTVSIDVARATTIRGTTSAFAGSTVSLRTLNDEVADSTVADGRGTWSFRVAPGAYRVAVEAHATWLAYRSAVVHVGTTALTVRSRPARTATLRGTVTSGGRPVQGAFVSLSGPAGIAYPELLAVRTDARGRWTIGGLAPARYRVAVAGPPAGSLIARRLATTLSTGEQARVDARLTPGAWVTATVRVPASRTRWKAVLQEADGDIVRTAASLLHPRTSTPLSFSGLPAGRYRLLLANGDRMLDRSIRVAARSTARLGVLRPDTAALEVRGTAPAGADITFELGTVTARTTAAADGSFRLGGLVPGLWRIRSGRVGHLAADSTAVLPAAGPLTLADGPAAETEFHLVHGTVTAGGIPVPVAAVHLRGGSFLGVSDGRLGVANVSTNVLPAGVYDVTSVTARSTIGSLLPRATPYYLTWTGPRIVVPAGADDPDIGAVDLAVRGGP